MAYEDVFRSIRIRSGKIGGLYTQHVIQLPGTVAEFGFPFNAVTKTEQAAAYAKVYDLSAAAYLDLSGSSAGGGYTADYQIFPDTEAAGDYAIFGAAVPFGVLWFDMSVTGATYAQDSITWQYWNGTSWSTLTILWDDSNTTPAAGGKRPFMQDGHILFSAPTDWAQTTIDDQEAYWIRAYVDAAQITQIPLTDSHEHYIVTDANASRSPCDGEVERGRFTFVTNSASNDHTDVILCNLTSGACSAIKAVTKALNKGTVVADFDLKVEKDDYLAFYVSDEDGSTEYANGACELTILRK